MADVDIAIKLAAQVGQTLPAAYVTFLDGLPLRPTLGEGFCPILEFTGRRWRPYGRDELAGVIRFNRGKVHPRAHETAAVAEELRAEDARLDGEMSEVLIARGFTLERLARGFCIGDDGNGEPLFVDSENGSVYAYYHDGMDVEKWADSLAELISESMDLSDEEANEH